MVADHREVVVALAGVEVARSHRAIRVLETSHPPTFYVPREDVRIALLSRVAGRTSCEWKGEAAFFDIIVGNAVDERARRAAWSYEAPFDDADAIAGHVAFYASLVTATVDGVKVIPQEGGFYGGWITQELVGPFKGGPGTAGW